MEGISFHGADGEVGNLIQDPPPCPWLREDRTLCDRDPSRIPEFGPDPWCFCWTAPCQKDRKGSG